MNRFNELKDYFLVAMYIVGFIFFATVWLHLTNHRDEQLMDYGDCVAEANEGSSIPLKDAWVIYEGLCQQ